MSLFFYLCLLLSSWHSKKIVAEVILSLLVESFKFSFSDKKVFWKTFGLASPALVEDPSVPRLPLMVEQR